MTLCGGDAPLHGRHAVYHRQAGLVFIRVTIILHTGGLNVVQCCTLLAAQYGAGGTLHRARGLGASKGITVAGKGHTLTRPSAARRTRRRVLELGRQRCRLFLALDSFFFFQTRALFGQFVLPH